MGNTTEYGEGVIKKNKIKRFDGRMMKFFVDIWTHIKSFKGEYRMPFDEITSNVECLRYTYCPFTGTTTEKDII